MCQLYPILNIKIWKNHLQDEMKKSAEPATLHMLYQSHYETLVRQRDELIAEIEDVNQQIVELKKEALEKGMPLNNSQ
jgi:hypothetical protein